MLFYLRHFVKSMAPNSTHAEYNLLAKMFTPIQFYCKPSHPSPSSDIIDINIDKMMNEDDEFASNCNYEPEPHTAKSTAVSDSVIAPIDIDAWVDEEVEKQGTFDMDYIEKGMEEIHYPEPPKDRTGYYEFEGIKIWLPKKMLTPATYRYRLTDEEEQTLPDDIRICKFEKFKPTS